MGDTIIEGRVIDVKEDPASPAGLWKGIFFILAGILYLQMIAFSVQENPLAPALLCCNGLFVLLILAIGSGISRRTGTSPVPNRATRLHDLRLQVLEQHTTRVMNVRLEHVGTDATVPLQAEVKVQGKMRGAVCFATKVELNAGRGMVTLWPRRYWFWRIGSAVLLVIVWSGFASFSERLG